MAVQTLGGGKTKPSYEAYQEYLAARKAAAVVDEPRTKLPLDIDKEVIGTTAPVVQPPVVEPPAQTIVQPSATVAKPPVVVGAEPPVATPDAGITQPWVGAQAEPVTTPGQRVDEGAFQTNSLLQQLIDAINAPRQDVTQTRGYQEYRESVEAQVERATEKQQRAVSEEMARRGILRSTITAGQLADVAETLGAQGQQLIADRLIQLQQMDDQRRAQSISEIQAVFNMTYKIRQDEYNRRLDEINLAMKQQDRAWDRLDRLGYADEETAMILGIDPWTPSQAAREAALDRQSALQREQLRIQAEKDANYAKLKEANPFYEEMPSYAGQMLYDNAIDVLSVSPEMYGTVTEDLKNRRGKGEISNEDYISVMNALQSYKATFGMRTAIIESLKAEEEPAEEDPYQHFLSQINAALTDMSVPDAEDRFKNAQNLLMQAYGIMSDEDAKKLFNHLQNFAKTNQLLFEE